MNLEVIVILTICILPVNPSLYGNTTMPVVFVTYVLKTSGMTKADFDQSGCTTVLSSRTDPPEEI